MSKERMAGLVPSNHPNKRYYAGSLQTLAVTMLGTLPSVYSGWVSGLSWGYGYVLIFSIVSSVTFFIYICCMSELTSTLPFPGGTYALARLTVGFYPGFLVGCAEIFYYLLAVAIYNFALISVINVVWPVTMPYQGEIIALLFLVQLCICMSKRIFWTLITIIAIGALIVNLSFLFGSIKYFDFQTWGYSYPNFDYTAKKVLYTPSPTTEKTIEIIGTIPFTMEMFMGMEIVNLMCDEVPNPRRQIPFGQTVGAFIMCCLNIVIPLMAVSMYPGAQILGILSNPLVVGLSVIFKLDVYHAISLQMIAWFGWATYGTYGLSKLLAAMAQSRLLPPILAATHWERVVNHYLRRYFGCCCCRFCPCAYSEGEGAGAAAAMPSSATGLTARVAAVTHSSDGSSGTARGTGGGTRAATSTNSGDGGPYRRMLPIPITISAVSLTSCSNCFCRTTPADATTVTGPTDAAAAANDGINAGGGATYVAEGGVDAAGGGAGVAGTHNTDVTEGGPNAVAGSDVLKTTVMIGKRCAHGLCPGVFTGIGDDNGVPFLSTLLGSILSSIAFVVYFECYNLRMAFTSTSVLAICALSTYFVQLLGFMTLRLKLSQFPREYWSPFGIPGCLVSAVWFLFGFVVVLFLRPEGKYTASVMAVWFVLVTTYYFMVGRHQQVFSEAEKAVILPAHAEVKNANGK
jgi:amino acid transporter